MEKFICKECGKEYGTLKGMSQHRNRQHGIPVKQTYIEEVLNGEEPTCACGCDEKPTFLSITKGYNDYIRGHASRVNNNWGHNPEAMRKSHETQKEMHASGEVEIWNKGLTMDDDRVRKNIEAVMNNPNRSKNISKSLKGKPKSEEHKRKLSESQKKSWADPDKRERQRFNRLEYFKNKQFNSKSKLEKLFEELLKELSIDFENQFHLNGYLYDFYIEGKNTLIEVDGDWYHCNPKKHPEPLSPIQKNTVKNDRIKNKLAKEKGYTLIRFWEDDINNNIDNVINILKLLI